MICLPTCKTISLWFGKQTTVFMQCLRSLKLRTHYQQQLGSHGILAGSSLRSLERCFIDAPSSLAKGSPSCRYVTTTSELGVRGHLHLQHHSGERGPLLPLGMKKWTENTPKFWPWWCWWLLELYHEDDGIVGIVDQSTLYMFYCIVLHCCMIQDDVFFSILMFTVSQRIHVWNIYLHWPLK